MSGAQGQAARRPGVGSALGRAAQQQGAPGHGGDGRLLLHSAETIAELNKWVADVRLVSFISAKTTKTFQISPKVLQSPRKGIGLQPLRRLSGVLGCDAQLRTATLTGRRRFDDVGRRAQPGGHCAGAA